jgi:hypothetical protein
MTAPDIPMARTRTDRRNADGLFRWMPLVAIALGLGGFALMLIAPGQAVLSFSALMAGVAIASCLSFVGPMRIGGGSAVPDEFGHALHMRAYLATFASIAITAYIGMLLVTGLALLGNWTREMLITALIGLALFLPLLWTAVPTLYASWSVQPLDDD